MTVRVAETLGSREALADEILGRSVLPLVAVALVALGLLWFGVQRAFAPLAVVERELRRRAPDDLQPVSAPVPQEVSRLVEALNAFMHRLSGLMNTLNTLVADAAHRSAHRWPRCARRPRSRWKNPTPSACTPASSASTRTPRMPAS